MARPQKKGLDYFPLDVNFLQDKKLRLIKGEFGAKGIIILLAIWDKIYSDNGYFYKWDDDDCFLMSEGVGCGCTPELVGEVLAGCVKRSLFDERVFNMFGVLTSAGIQRRYLTAKKDTLKKAAAEGRHIGFIKDYWLIEKNELVTFSQSTQKTSYSEKNPSYSEKNPSYSYEEYIKESKVKESKGKKSKEKESRVDTAIASATSPFYDERLVKIHEAMKDVYYGFTFNNIQQQEIVKYLDEGFEDELIIIAIKEKGMKNQPFKNVFFRLKDWAEASINTVAKLQEKERCSKSANNGRSNGTDKKQDTKQPKYGTIL